MWYTLALILIVIASILLILIVLVQNPKGGGLASGFTGVNQFGGVAQTNKFLEKTTWTLAVAILALSILASATAPRKTKQKTSALTEITETIDFNQAPSVPQINTQPVNPTTTNDNKQK